MYKKEHIMKRISFRFALTMAAALSIGLAAPAYVVAQSTDGFGGSFDTGGGGVPALPSTPAPAGDNFGGSFGGGGGAVVPQPGPPPVPAPTGGGFEGGSFDGGGGGVVPAPPPPPPPAPTPAPPPPPPIPQPIPQPAPQPTPPAPAPTPAPQPGPQIDPQITAFETREFGVQPTQQLRQNNFHAQTPTSVPGAQLVTTQVLANAIQSGVPVVLIDVLGSEYSLPNAYVAPALASAGSLNDRTQQQAAQWLGQITGNNKGAVIAIYCSDPMCWLSYNATLRTVAAGYTNVYWYRGGMQAWQMAGLQVTPAGF